VDSGKHGDSRFWRGLLYKAGPPQLEGKQSREAELRRKEACERYSFGAKSLERCMAEEKKKEEEMVWQPVVFSGLVMR
jgi:hypothetical protein